jgi:hypothetical protein
MSGTLFNLILKDLALQKKMLVFLVFFVVLLMFSLSTEGGASPYITATVGASVFWTLSVCSYEGFYKSDRLFASLPISRNEMVRSRYLGGVLALLIAIAIVAVIGFLASALGMKEGLRGITTSEALISFLTASFLLFGYLPVYFKVGYLKSRMLNIVVFAILGVVIAGISLLMDAIGVTSLGISTTAMVLIVLVLWIILGLVSYTLATRFFAKRAL